MRMTRETPVGVPGGVLPLWQFVDLLRRLEWSDDQIRLVLHFADERKMRKVLGE
jgi:hypothetical protein